jgi:Protein of unknown function (DUF2726)
MKVINAFPFPTIGILFLIFIILHGTMAFADILVLKNGKQIRAEYFWEEDGVVKYSSYGSIVGYPIKEVDKVVREDTYNDERGKSHSIFYPWVLGVYAEEAISICERFDFPLHRDGLISANKHFNAKMCRPYIQTSNIFTYKTNTFNGPSRYTLTFDPATKRLSGVEIQILKPAMERSESFFVKINDKISREYGAANISGSRRIWQRGKNHIELLNGGSAAVIRLSDKPFTYAGPATHVSAKTLKPASLYSRMGKNSNGLSSTAIIKEVSGPIIFFCILLASIACFKIYWNKTMRSILSRGIKAKKNPVRPGQGLSSTGNHRDGVDCTYEKAYGLFTKTEQEFLSVLKTAIGDRYLIQGKVRLADIITPESGLNARQAKWAFRRISQKHVDFAIYNKNDYTILGVVELDDRSHLRPDRVARDRFVDDALAAAHIPIWHQLVKKAYSVPELREDLREAFGLDSKEASKSEKFEDDDRPFTDKGDDSRWAPPKFKL